MKDYGRHSVEYHVRNIMKYLKGKLRNVAREPGGLLWEHSEQSPSNFRDNTNFPVISLRILFYFDYNITIRNQEKYYCY